MEAIDRLRAIKDGTAILRNKRLDSIVEEIVHARILDVPSASIVTEARDMDTRDPDPRNQQKSRMPYLLWFLGLHMAEGAAIGVIFSSLLIMTNAAGLRDLLLEQSYLLPMLLFYIFNALTFASISMGIAVMRLPNE